MMKYYVRNINTKKLEEVTEEDFSLLAGTKETHPYIRNLYTKQITEAGIPENLREEVVSAVNARNERFGEYQQKGEMQ